MKRIIASLGILAWHWLTPLSAQQEPGSHAGMSGTYRLGPGDVLDIVVFEVEELSRSAVVGPQGSITLPLLGEVPVFGRSTLEVERELTRRYGSGLVREPHVSVSVKHFQSQPVSIVGAVEKPGVYQLRGQRRLVDVLALAGGLSPDVGEVITISRQISREEGDAWGLETSAASSFPGEPRSWRPRSEELRVPVRDLLTMSRQEGANPVIQPHDVVRVEKAGLVYVLGAVVRPGGFPIRDQERITVLRAVSLATGMARNAAPQKAKIIRKVEGEKREIPVRIKDILSGREPDRQLADNDILYVPDSRAKSALHRGTEAFIQTATGVIIWRR